MTIRNNAEPKDVWKYFQSAEEEIKRAEQASLKLSIPAINELRYAGHHFLKGIVSTKEQERGEQFLRAIRHCQRARYDAIEIKFWYYLETFRKFQDDYRKVSIPSVWPNYVDQARHIDKAKSILESVVKSEDIDEQADTRVELLERTIEFCEEIGSIISKTIIARTELNKLLADNRVKELYGRRVLLISMWTLIVTFLGLIVAIVAPFILK